MRTKFNHNLLYCYLGQIQKKPHSVEWGRYEDYYLLGGDYLRVRRLLNLSVCESFATVNVDFGAATYSERC